MIAEAIQKILGLATPNQITKGKLTYVDKNMDLIKPPAPGAVSVGTLQGLVDLFKAELDQVAKEGDVLFHVTSSTRVEIISRVSDDYGRRRCWVQAEYPKLIRPFPFGTWLDPESFVIQCQAGFQRVKIENEDGTFALDLDYVLKIASAITAEAIDVSEDDGISQKVSARRGVVLKEQTNLKPRVNLAPYRTFAEIDQQLSQFVFRARVGGDSVNLALFEADGGRWHLSAIAAIAEWLATKIGGKVPVIS
jgi:hypothetical protein